jgi:hypothetical protein
MKRTIFFYLFLLLLADPALAQNRFKLGLKAGLSTSQVHGDTYSGFHKAGLDAGLTLNGKINEKWSAQFEMLYVQKGSKHQGDITQGDYSFYLMKLSYVEVPILFEYKLKKFVFELGPGFGYLASAKEYDFNGPIRKAAPFKSMEISGSLGVNYMLWKRLGVNWRYTNSLLPIRVFELPNVNIPYDAGQRNNVLSFTLTYVFGNQDAE